MSESYESPILIGTSGYSYKEWKGLFYPPDLAAKDYLSFYSKRFPTTEINNTFYRFPTESTSTGWRRQVPEGFRFAVKLTQKISHHRKLRDAGEDMEWFLKGIEPLRAQLAAILVQLPPYLRKDIGALRAFLDSFGEAPLAFEFRHASWMDEEVRTLLADRKAALVIAETDEVPALRELTGRFAYLRLRKSSYESGELEDWARWIQEQNLPRYAYLKHDQQAPILASRLSDLVHTGVGSS
jgi:uncharacterized protein YecE (DUF72 family)